MLRVYVAGPLTRPAGHEMPNMRRAVDTGQALFKAGFAPFIPHLNEFWFLIYPENTYEEFIAWDLAWIIACDALLRLPGYSEGADRECLFAEDNGIPVFHTVEDVVAWRERTKGQRFPREGLACCECDGSVESIIDIGEEPKYERPGIAITFFDGPIQVISSAICLACYVTTGGAPQSDEEIQEG